MQLEIAMRQAIEAMLQKMRQEGGECIKSVSLVVGASEQVSEDKVRSHFNVLAFNTPAEKAALTIEWIPATFQCSECRDIFNAISWNTTTCCPKCGEAARQIAHHIACYPRSIKVCPSSPK
jgi:Zn finger protein HypA/HybF involved in hydrogenase expression